ncbi:2-oxo acid dehydrogenase subunit E2 [Micromonospora zingiberis]|uniref:Dihydrolipoamide acetyltransferase component of pyruvate dehydrogenase complex n=1 Tax=Micromonospora zingiberis TaxID=2053011 RepID=A0A4R0GRP4_9ACTN|nr:dihydrolipoamide acetyltransferase family protein [Micromonospora zingiberis]TCB98321.1 2-oxo acid dehydrogenase subunit E2 [Micromonospora zingiberis]
MAHILRVPETAGAEAALLTWFVAENASFAAGDTLVSLETDKAVLDIDAEADGVLVKILVEEGRHVETAGALAVLGAPGETVDVTTILNGPDAATASPPTAAAPATPAPVTDLTAATGVPAATDAAAVPAAVAPATDAAAPVGPGESRARLFASPIARRLAREAGLDLARIAGTGSNGRITRRDVEAARAARSTTPPPPVVGGPSAAGATLAVASPPNPVPTPRETAAATPDGAGVASSVPTPTSRSAVSAPSGVGYTEIPHSRIRRTIASRLVASKQQTPHFYLRGSARVDDLLALREQINQGRTDRVSVTDLLLKAVALAHVAVPAMNVTWTDEAVRQYRSVDVSVAVATDHGLVAPVLRGVDSMSLAQVSAGVRDLAARARAGRIQPDDLVGGTVSLSNLGGYGTEEFAAIINPPQAAILAVGAARAEPVVQEGRIEVGTVLRVTLSVDHRPVDGAVAAEWMRTFLALLEAPLRILTG